MMIFIPRSYLRFLFFFVLAALFAFSSGIIPAKANNASAVLPFSQDWTNTGLITVNDDWSGVQSIVGYRGDALTAVVGADPQTILAGDDAAPVMDVNANLANPNTNVTGGVTEFDGIANPVIALQGSATADAPYIKIFLNTTGINNIRIFYNVRDIDGSTDNAIQQVALQYRVGSSGNFTNIATGFVADATTGPSLATLVTSVNVTLPVAVDNQPVVELRIMTTNATGNDEWVGIDDIFITANYAPTGFSLSPNSVFENQPAGVLVGTLTAVDTIGDTHTFTLVNSALCAGNGVDNVNFSLTGNNLSTTATFDFETKASYQICVTVTDNNGLSFTGEHTVTITDVADETPPSVSLEQAVGQNDPTNVSPIIFTVLFSESVTGFDESDVDLSLSTTGGLLSATVTDMTPSHTTFNVVVSGMTSDGDVIASVSAGAAVDGTGNASLISSSLDNKVSFSTDTTLPFVTIEQASLQLDPTNISPINFTVVFSEPVIGFDGSDVILSGTAGATTVTVAEIAPNDATTFNAMVSGMSSTGTVIAEVKAGAATDAIGNASAASVSVDKTVTYSTDTGAPHVLFSANTIPANNSVLITSPTQLQIEFDEDIKNDGSAGAANNDNNFLLVKAGTNTVFDTVSCAGGLISDDVMVKINTATYTNNSGNGPYIATLNINGGASLPPGSYRLFVCGTTSIEDLLGNKLNDGLSDTLISFTISELAGSSSGTSDVELPATGFPIGQITRLPSQPANKAYASFSDLWLEIPKMKVATPIVGVPLSKDGWDVSWLGTSAGWLNETAFPTWAGNSVITAHVWDAFNQPGTFYKLKELRYGDQIKVHAFGQTYLYEVRETKRIAPDDLSAVLVHENKAWLTLITCEEYRLLFHSYSYRRVVRAVLIAVIDEK